MEGHEGSALASVKDRSGLSRELTYPADDVKRSDLSAVQAVCECGWRSPYFSAPGAEYIPFMVVLPPHSKAKAETLWQEHIDHVRALQQQGQLLAQPLRRARAVQRVRLPDWTCPGCEVVYGREPSECPACGRKAVQP